MKKALHILIIGAFIFYSCNNNKKEQTSPNILKDSNEEITNSPNNSTLFKFDDPDIQKFMDSYANLIKDFKAAKAEQDTVKMGLILPKMQKLTEEAKHIVEKLKNNSEDTEKFKKYMIQLEEEFQQGLTK